MNRTGSVTLVGAGPGDLRLLTVGGWQALAQADVVLYDHLVGGAILALCPETSEKIPVGKEAGNHTLPQGEIQRLLVEKAREGKRVVRLKGGDPFLFGRGGEEAEALRAAGVPYEVIPGVTSAFSVPACAGIPVTHRGYSASVHVFTAHREKEGKDPLDYTQLAALSGTLVFLMGVHAVPSICQGLLTAGMEGSTPAAIIEKGTVAGERVLTAPLRELAEKAEREKIGTPGILLVGEVCALRDSLSWREQLPLYNKRLFVTRPRSRSAALAGPLRELGAEVIEIPSISLSPRSGLDELWGILEENAFDRMVFTSPSGVEMFFDALRKKRMDVRSLAGKKIAVIGPATARKLEERGLFADCMPARYDTQALADLLTERAPGDRILLLRSAQGNPELFGRLQQAGIRVRDIPLYDTKWENEQSFFSRLLADCLKGEENEYVLFTSASTVRGFCRMLPPGFDPARIQAVCIGEPTAKAAREKNMQVFVAEKASGESMVVRCLELAHPKRKASEKRKEEN